tara:strand:- start:1911 stop:2102 length:192 start_codon:yes stop_codon:yes gene_type:complete
MKNEPTEKELTRWARWGIKAPLRHLFYGIIVFPLGATILSTVFLDLPYWGLKLGLLIGIPFGI